MYFSSIPEAYAPVGAPLRYALTGGTADETLVRILADGDRLLGVKRLTEPQPVAFDIAPYLRPALRFAPRSGSSGVLGADERAVTVTVEASCGAETIRSVVRTFTAADRTVQRPALLTTMPAERLLDPGGCDELTLLTSGPLPITVTAEGGGATRVANYAVSSAGLHRFRLAAADFAGAERLTVDLAACGTVRYTLLPAPEGARTLAWRSRAGSLEHYTFPLVQRVVHQVAKRRAVCSAGIEAQPAAAEERLELQGAFEPAAQLAGLAGLLEAEQVWLVDEGLYRPVDVLTESAELHRHGSMRALTLTLRSTVAGTSLWSC